MGTTTVQKLSEAWTVIKDAWAEARGHKPLSKDTLVSVLKHLAERAESADVFMAAVAEVIRTVPEVQDAARRATTVSVMDALIAKLKTVQCECPICTAERKATEARGVC